VPEGQAGDDGIRGGRAPESFGGRADGDRAGWRKGSPECLDWPRGPEEDGSGGGARSGFQLLERYRGRGGAERDFGELNGAFHVGLPSSPRPKAHYRGTPVHTPSVPFDASAANEARGLLTLYAANVLHAARTVIRRRDQRLWYRRRSRDHILKVPAASPFGRRWLTVSLPADRSGPWAQATYLQRGLDRVE
jgi:hypothetical protein